MSRNSVRPNAALQKSLEIKKAAQSDASAILDLYVALNRPRRRLRIREYFVAQVGAKVVACGAVRRIENTGYLYGLAVVKEWRRVGIGSELILRRLGELRKCRIRSAVLLTMFWNVTFFRRLGFQPVARTAVHPALRRVNDFRARKNRFCTVMMIEL
jgi:N-acetylglutamate synthase-like GNAT family acetyltransferase